MQYPFKFKQFQVDQTGTTMKINTDGVLLGALAEHKTANRVLDVGTGTGVIAMMLAQRYPKAHVEAIEKDELASALAKRNFENSVFADRIVAYNMAFQDFIPEEKYDLIVSNPPFFLNALENPDKRKSQARHTDAKFYDELLVKASDWLNTGGSLQLVLPKTIATAILAEALTKARFLHTKTIHIRSFDSTLPFRQIVFLEKADSPDTVTTTNQYFTLYENKGVYSAAYKVLLHPFFLNF